MATFSETRFVTLEVGGIAWRSEEMRGSEGS